MPTITEKAAQFARSYPPEWQEIIRNAYIEGYNNGMKSKTRKKEIDVSFIASEFQKPMFLWFDYKKERKQAYTQSGAEVCYKHLIELSQGNPDLAHQIVEQSIANNWQGLFPLKNQIQPYGTQQQSNNHQQQRQSSDSRSQRFDDIRRKSGQLLRYITDKDRT